PEGTILQVTVAPISLVEVCGLGVGVLGSGSTSSCLGSQRGDAAAGSSTANGSTVGASASPVTQASVCGVGVGVFGNGSTGSCSGTQGSGSSASASDASASPSTASEVCGVGVGAGGTGSSSDCNGVQAVSGRAAAAVGGTSVRRAVAATAARGSLPFTGGGTSHGLVIAGLLALLLGGTLLGLRRRATPGTPCIDAG